MIYVEFLQKYFNKWNLHLTNICWEKKLELVKRILMMLDLQPQYLGFYSWLIKWLLFFFFLLQL
jgi:hypothetical protein